MHNEIDTQEGLHWEKSLPAPLSNLLQNRSLLTEDPGLEGGAALPEMPACRVLLSFVSLAQRLLGNPVEEQKKF